MTLSESMSESVSEVHRNLVSVSGPTSEIEIFYLSESMSELMSEPMSVSASEPLSESNQVQSGRSQAVKVDGRAIVLVPGVSFLVRCYPNMKFEFEKFWRSRIQYNNFRNFRNCDLLENQIVLCCDCDRYSKN